MVLAASQLLLVIPGGYVRRLWGPACLAQYVSEKGFDRQDAGNLRQLCDYDKVGKDRSGRGVMKGHYLLDDDVTWLKDPMSREYLPLLGSWAKKLDQLKKGTDLDFTLSTFRRKVLGNGQLGRWHVGPAPTFLATVPDGTSIYGLRVSSTRAPTLRTHACPC